MSAYDAIIVGGRACRGLLRNLASAAGFLGSPVLCSEIAREGRGAGATSRQRHGQENQCFSIHARLRPWYQSVPTAFKTAPHLCVQGKHLGKALLS